MKDDEIAPHRSKKDRKKWCGGHVGREHAEVIAVPASFASFRACGYYGWTIPDRWDCRHARMCETCGKILGTFFWSGEGFCPDFKPKD